MWAPPELLSDMEASPRSRRGTPASLELGVRGPSFRSLCVLGFSALHSPSPGSWAHKTMLVCRETLADPPALPVGRFPLLHGVVAGEALQRLWPTGFISLSLHKVCKERTRKEPVKPGS